MKIIGDLTMGNKKGFMQQGSGNRTSGIPPYGEDVQGTMTTPVPEEGLWKIPGGNPWTGSRKVLDMFGLPVDIYLAYMEQYLMQ